MTKQKGRFQYARPVWIRSLESTNDGELLGRRKFSSSSNAADEYDEAWLQRLLYRFPQALPITELEPAINNVLPVGREVPTPAGSIDNVFVSPEGSIILVECKLWRNAEARRKVIAQIIDYAQSMARWRYTDFDAAIRRSKDAEDQIIGKSLAELVGVAGDFDEAAFEDAVNKNLRLGRMLLLVIGDGIREDTESLADYLQFHAGFHFSLGLIEIAVFELPDGGFIVQPRVLARTLNIERAVVRLASDAVVVQPAATDLKIARVGRSTSMTDDLFFEKLESNSAQAAKLLRDLLNQAEAAGLDIYLDPATKSAGLKWESADGTVFNLGAVRIDGTLTTSSVCWVNHHPERMELAHGYLRQLGELVNGSVRETKDPSQWYVVKSGTQTPLAVDLLSKWESWFEIIRTYQGKLNETVLDNV